jgi:signal transduction histidine kinase
MTATSENLWEIIGQSGASPICAFDHDCRLIAFNRAHSDEFFRIYKYRVQIGDCFPDLFLPEQSPIIRAFMERALAGEIFNVIEEFGDPTIVRPYWDIAYAPLRDGTGKIIGAFHHAQDISARLRAEAELRAAHHALQQAQKMEAVGQLTGGIAHDFNNILMAVSGNLELTALRLAADDPARAYVENALTATDKGARLTAQLLAFSRTQRLDIRPTELDPSLRNAIGLVRASLGPDISLELRLGAEDCWAATAVDQLDLAMLNLVRNARDAMPDGGRLTISSLLCRARPPGGGPLSDYLCIRVTDTGTGMTSEVASQAMEPFFTTKPRGKGTGLGLAQVYGFARQCGGDVKITSAVGEGSTIEILLPRVDPKATAPSPPTPRAAPRPDPGPDPGKGETILVIDDDDSVRTLIADALRTVGFAVIEANGGEAGLKQLDDITPAACVVDYIMPGMNGAEVARRIQARHPQLPVIFLSGYYDTIALDGISGAVILRKPIDMSGLHNAVSTAIH